MLFSSPNKVIQITKEIDSARCKGHWHTIPDLARRYVKYNPEGTALEQMILAEATLVRLGQTTKPWEQKQVSALQDQLQSVFELLDNTSDELKESAKVVLARLFFACQEYDQVLALLDGISLLTPQSSGYTFILYYQSVAIKAMSFEMTGDIESSLQVYEYVANLLEDRIPTKELTLAEWAEQTLYRANKLVSCNNSVTTDSSNILLFLRAYHRATYYQSVSWRTERRIDITLSMIKLLSKQYRSGNYIPCRNDVICLSPSTNENENVQDYRNAFVEEMIELYTICERMLQVPFSKGQQQSDLLMDFIEHLAKDVDLMIETIDDLKGYKEVLDRASEKSFNSPGLLRHSFLTLIRIGDYEEAQLVLRSYLQLVGLLSHERLDARQDGEVIMQDHHGRYIPQRPVATTTNSSTTAKRLSLRNTNDHPPTNVESVSCQLSVLIEAIKMFCKHLGKGVDAVELAELALDLVKTSPATIKDDRLISNIYRTAGVAYGLLASQTINSAKRPEYHEKALELLQQSNKILPDVWETYYYLAHQYADMRNISTAIQYIRQSLTLNSDHIPSWHLLTLALSCPGQEGYSQALSIASMGIQIGKKNIYTLASTRSSILATTYDDEEQLLLLQLTHSKLTNVCEGPTQALETHPLLFKLYGQWVTEGTNYDDIDFSVLDDRNNDLPWSGRLFSTGDQSDKVPRPLIISGSFGNLRSMSSLPNYPTSTTSSSSLISSSAASTTTSKPHKSLRRRSASSSMISHFLSPNGAPNGDTVSVLSTKTVSNNDHYKSDDKISFNMVQRSPSLRKYASNSMLKVPTTATTTTSGHSHWHGLHLFPSRSTSRRIPSQSQSGDGFSVIKDSISNDSLSKQSGSERAIRYNSSYSMQSNTGAGGLATPSIHDSINTNHSPPPMIPSLFIPQQHHVMSTRAYLRHQRHHLVLCELWLVSAEWFVAQGQWEEASKAISEAEQVCPGHPDVWSLLGQISRMKQDSIIDHHKDDDDDDGEPDDIKERFQTTMARYYFEKGVSIDSSHMDCQIGLAKLYMEQQQTCLAEGILISLTKSVGWHSAEAWYLLGQVYQQTDRQLESKNCLLYALDLEASQPIQPFHVLPRFVID
ncbi:uncharacterized protein BX664DRAFT_386363 [Halteromyces radiatus]|uniref:uncharacterized protein n=1 Tax=Halteromyces radiatus TaxID=101107 RepID=UPI00221FCC9A|nr:uncharacterized protein BX664DRAFT_386363 [Halteromyces radiatus]KAI8089965.1 hypothetical protein BX664DRAFT_386363 [Halteromyces radiatus]